MTEDTFSDLPALTQMLQQMAAVVSAGKRTDVSWDDLGQHLGVMTGAEYVEVWVPISSGIKHQTTWFDKDSGLSELAASHTGINTLHPQGILNEALTKKKIIIPEQLAGNSQFTAEAMSLEAAGLHSALSFPVIVDTKVVAVVILARKGEAEADQSEIEKRISFIQAGLATLLSGFNLVENYRQEADMFRAYVNALPDMIVGYDDNFTITFISKTIEKITGNPAESYIGKTVEQLDAPPHILKLWKENFTELYETGQPVNFLYDIQLPQGGITFFATCVPFIDEDGKVTSFVGINRDITKLQKAEQEIGVLNQDLQSRVETLEKFKDTIVDRELKMVELKKTIDQLEAKLAEATH